MIDVLGDFEYDDSAVTYDGAISMSATVQSLDNRPLSIKFDVLVNAKMDYSWEKDEQPTGWNYRTDQPTYTSSWFPVGGNIDILSVSLDPESDVYIQDNRLPIESLNKYIHAGSVKKLLNPVIYENELSKVFDKFLQGIPMPESDGDY